MEMTFTSAQFSGDLFAMANDTDFTTENISVPITTTETVNSTTFKVELSTTGTVDSTKTAVFGLVQYDADGDSTLDDNEFRVEPGSNSLTLTFAASMAGKEVEITYYQTQSASVINIDNKTTAVGELILKYPVYSTGDEAKAAGVKGYYLMDVLKCRVTAMPGFDSSYKNAATNQVTFSTMDPKGDHVYKCAYYEVSST